MKKLITTALAGTFLALFSLSGIASAQIGINVGAGASGSSSNSDTSVDAQSDISVSSDNDSSDPNAEEPSSDASSDADISLSLTRDQVVSASLDAESAELDSISVSSNADLSAFATSRMKRDDNIESVESADGRITLEYRKEARFLGFVPGHINATAEVTDDGTVAIHYPWYRFFFSVEGSSDAEAQLQARVQELMSSNGSAQFSASLGAQLIEAMHIALQGSASATTDSN